MKMNKKGFTLVELLAVIVILAIIALIAVPIILNVIDDAREKAAMDSAYGYIDAVEKANVQEILSNSNIEVLNGTYTISSGGASVIKGSTGFAINFKGSAPSEGTLTYENGKLKDGTITISSKTFKIQSDGSLKSTTKASTTPSA